MMICQMGAAQKVTTSLSILANPITGRLGDLETEELGMGYYPTSIKQSVGPEIGLGVNITKKQHWGGGIGFSFKQMNRSYRFTAAHPYIGINSYYITDTILLFDENLEIDRIDFNLHGRLFIHVKSWQAQLLVGYNQPIITQKSDIRVANHIIWGYAQNDQTGEISNRYRRGITLVNRIENADHNLLAEIYLGKEIKDRLYLNVGVKYSIPDNTVIATYDVTGNLGEANGFIYDDTNYNLNQTRITNQIFMFSLGVTYDINFKNLF